MIVAGFGFRASATQASLQDAFDRACNGPRPDHAATAQDKATAPVFAGFAQGAGLDVIAVDSQALSAQQTTTRSAVALATRQTGSVAEAAALAAAGPGAKLICDRVISADGRATCAVAKGQQR